MAKLTEDKGIKAGFSCRCAMEFAMGIPLLKDHFELESMEVTDITSSGVRAFLDDGEIEAKEIIPDKVFLFSSDTEAFILNLEFKSDKKYGYLFQAGDQYGVIYSMTVKNGIDVKKEEGKALGKTVKGYYTLLTEKDLFPDIYTFIVSTADETWGNLAWEKDETHSSLMEQVGPGRKYTGMVDVQSLNEEQIERFGEEIQLVFCLSQAKNDESKIQAILVKYRDTIDQMDMATSLMVLAFYGPEHYEYAKSSKIINCEEDKRGMLNIYFNNAVEYCEARVARLEEKMKKEAQEAKEQTEKARQEAREAKEQAEKAQQEAQEAKEQAEKQKEEDAESFAKDMLKDGVPLSMILKYTKLTEEKIRKLAEAMNVSVA